MKISLKKSEKIKFFHTALCNGLSYIAGYGLVLTVEDGVYYDARNKLHGETCIEDVLIQILKDGNHITIEDTESEESHDITLEMVLERMNNVDNDHLIDMEQERDDAETADAILQTIIFNEVIYG